jgi:hypothetical protein
VRVQSHCVRARLERLARNQSHGVGRTETPAAARRCHQIPAGRVDDGASVPAKVHGNVYASQGRGGTLRETYRRATAAFLRTTAAYLSSNSGVPEDSGVRENNRGGPEKGGVLKLEENSGVHTRIAAFLSSNSGVPELEQRRSGARTAASLSSNSGVLELEQRRP